MNSTSLLRAPAARRDSSRTIDELADEMVACWGRGEFLPTEAFLERHPELAGDAAAVLELVAEEIALREEAEMALPAEEWAARFPCWAPQIRALLDCQKMLAPEELHPFPLPGERLGEFRILSELGRGASGRVFRAAQPELSDRPIVLKIGPSSMREHLALARLQHTNVVPLYSVHDFPERGQRALCMPYFGGSTLADWGKRSLPGIAAETALEAVCDIGAALADALDYAHRRGLVHFDIKPSNVLIAADGTPMLLDFHLARPPLDAFDPAPDWLGGTPGHMAPEHESALRAASRGEPIPAAVDGRADLFALGVLLRSLLEGNPVPTGLADILRRCTQYHPERRYPSGAALADDLRRQRDHRPLRGVRNRNPAEIWRKWRRRRPMALPLGMASLALFLLGAAGRMEFQRLRASAADARNASAVVEAQQDLHRFLEVARPLLSDGASPPAARSLAAERCRLFWANRARFCAPADDDTTELAYLAIRAGGFASREDEIAARDAIRQAKRENPQTEKETLWAGRLLADEGDPAALPTLRRARDLDPASFWANYEFGVASLKSGDATEAVGAFAVCAALSPRSGWCFANRGLALAAAGNEEAALADFDRAIALDPQRATAHFGKADIHRKRGDIPAALADLQRGADAGLEPEEIEYRRAGVYLAAGDRAEATRCLKRCLALRPERGEARRLLDELNR